MNKLFRIPSRSFGTKGNAAVPALKLRNGALMPQIGLGTWKSPPGVTQAAVEIALENGYTNLDTANDYNNEPEVGDGISNILKKGGIKRSDLFIQSKLWNSNHRPEHIKPDLEQTLADLKLNYIDSYVIHWPQACPSAINAPTLRTTGAYPAHIDKVSMFPYDDDGYFVADLESHYTETWEAMQGLVDSGIVRGIGLSNFNKKQIEEVLAMNLKHQPTLLQNECHPYLQQKDLIDFCNCNGIVFQAFSSLGSGDTHLAVSDSPTGTIPLKDPYIAQLAKKYGKSEGQIILRWHVQRKNGSYGLVTKSVTESRIVSNIQVYDFELSEEDMAGFDALNNGWRHLLWRETSNHPDYPFFDELPYGYQLEKAPLQSSSGTGDN
eukprot:CAMPEP_0201575256 /NCGR_PEP_ID=MMETSP0190_2-20130828/20339_1 /ASSEMBLY_ACC=CAM_ASM_000263 /TAXON_ID=37353 /ORGANISM="Rosalina sp." /LENGTH=378 /DNA_ID=CAMNT_0048004647 /DNA_START=99 /DNA_END=1235 /DNA_ORIENTATION=-